MSAPSGAGAVEALWNASSRRLRDWFERRTGSPEDADDLVQETFLRVQERLPSLRAEERIDGWTGRIAANVLADHGRTRARRTRSLDDEGGDQGEPGAAEPDGDLRAVVAGWLEAFLAAMDPDDAALLRAVDLEGRTQEDVARELSLSPSGARSRVQRARARLRERLEACCAFAFDVRGNLTDAERRARSACDCEDA